MRFLLGGQLFWVSFVVLRSARVGQPINDTLWWSALITLPVASAALWAEIRRQRYCRRAKKGEKVRHLRAVGTD